MGLCTFVRHVKERLTHPVHRHRLVSSQDMGVALALYFVYPAILWLHIDKFHGLCGPSVYVQKAAAVAANNAIFLPFTFLMRTHKIATILLFQADAAGKQEDPHDYVREYEHHQSEDGCTWLKFRVCFQLTQELVGICCVCFLLLICLPVLAFWFMLIGTLVTAFNMYLLLRRLWRDAHSEALTAAAFDDKEEDVIFDAETDGGEGEDLEFQEFLANFVDRSTAE